MPDRPAGPLGWRLDLAILLGAWAFVLLLHRSPGFLWGETDWILYHLLPTPPTLAGLDAAIRWQATTHTPGLVRPARAFLWWLGARTVGCDPLAHFVVTGLLSGVSVWAVARIAWYLTGSALRSALAAGCFALTYATSYGLLSFVAFAVSTTCGLGGLALAVGSEAAPRRRPIRACLGMALLLVAVLGHETFLALALVPLAHAVLVRRDRGAAVRALVFAAVIPLYAVAALLLAVRYGGGAHVALAGLTAWREAPGLLVEYGGRVLFTAASGGLPLDPIRALPWLPEYQRLRETVLTPAGLLTAAAVVLPSLTLAAAALVAARDDAAARRRLAFWLAWLAAGVLPLMLPFGSPEAFHLTGALPALFLAWSEAFRGRGRGRAAALAACAALVLWAGVHAGARWVLFHRDLPAMRSSVAALQRVLATAERDGAQARVLFFPIQFGGHYGMVPTLAPLYPAGELAPDACVRGELPRGCIVEPVWIWATLRDGPALPDACRTTDGVRVGPLDPAVTRSLEASRRILEHGGAGWVTRPSEARVRQARLLDACPLARERLVRDGRDYWLYRTEGAPDARWFRFTAAPARRLVAVEPCETSGK